jgi:hypothetical protein
MSNKNVSQDTLKKIQNKAIKPKPRWHFLLKDYVVWILGSISLLIGSLSFSVVLYMLINNDWDVYSQISGSMWQFTLTTLPYFWLLFLLIFILAAYYNFRHTKGGYRFDINKLIIGSVIFSMFFGGFLFKAGVGQAIDTLVSRNESFYKNFINRRAHVWSQTEKGLLAGVLELIEDEQHIVIRSMDGSVWRVSISGAKVPPVPIKIGDPLRIIGEAQEDNFFEAEFILPMRGMRFLKDRLKPHSMMQIKHLNYIERKNI